MNHFSFPHESPFLSRDRRGERWAIPYHFECLNGRIENLLWNQREAIEGQNILDIGSHMGTFAYAALEMGAKHVHCIDTDDQLIAQGKELFELHGAEKSRYCFETAEAGGFMKQLNEGAYDTILCFGLLYYCPDPLGLIRKMVRVVKQNILIDTFTASYAAVQGKYSLFIRNNIEEKTFNLPLMLTVPTQSRKNDYQLPDSFTKKGKTLNLSNYPTVKLLETWFEALKVSWQPLDWTPYFQGIKNWRELITQEQKKKSHWADVYSSGLRASFKLERKC